MKLTNSSGKLSKVVLFVGFATYKDEQLARREQAPFAAYLISGLPKNRELQDVKNVLTDGSYTGENFASRINDLIGATVEVVKRNELHTFVVLPKRGVVERSFSWLEKCRRLWKNCERKLTTSRSMVVLAFLVLLLKRF